MRIEVVLFLAGLTLAVAIAHVALTCRDRGNVTSVTIVIALGRGVGVLRKILPVR
jgi:hypothetical protein